MNEEKLSERLLTELERQVLHDICEFLAAPNAVQHLLAQEQTPTLSLVLPTYEKIIVLLKAMVMRLLKIAHAIRTAIVKVKEYFSKSRTTRIYALAMGKSPSS